MVIKFTTLPGNTGVYGKGRTLTHETGHFFYLYHIWGDEPNCDADDYIDDTLKQENYTSGCSHDNDPLQFSSTGCYVPEFYGLYGRCLYGDVYPSAESA